MTSVLMERGILDMATETQQEDCAETLGADTTIYKPKREGSRLCHLRRNDPAIPL
jgi:hypothetical protein